MSSEISKMLKCLTHRTYRSLQEDNCSTKQEEQTKRACSVGSSGSSHSEPPSTLASPQKTSGLQSIKAALGFRLRGSPRSLDKTKEDFVSCKETPVLRYTRFPPINTKNQSSTSGNKLSTTSSRVLSILRIHRDSSSSSKQLRERSKSDNSLQRFAVNVNSRSDHAIQKLLVRNSSEQHVFIPQSPPPPPPPIQKQLTRRSRSLERTSNFRVYPVQQSTSSSSSSSTDGCRSLERNHKFRISSSLVHHESNNGRHAFPHCESCPLASHNQEPIRAVRGNTVLLLPPTMTSDQSKSFVSKPDRGWLHSDEVLSRDGINYAVRYIGCLEVNTSMKSLDFETRSQIAKECINRVCEAAGLKTADKKRKVERRIMRVLAERPDMTHAGANVTLSISSTGLQLTLLDTGQLIARHDMPNISFASGGDPDTLDFMAYVAKDSNQRRSCMVLECGGGLAQDVITTVGQAFELRFKEYLRRTPTLGNPPIQQFTHTVPKSFEPTSVPVGDPDYYNDLPGKVPPDIGPPPVPPLPQYHAPVPTQQLPSTAPAPPPAPSIEHHRADSVGSNLIDLHSEVPRSSTSTLRRWERDYVNNDIQTLNNDSAHDVFDMQPFNATLTAKLDLQKQQLQDEVWFHGPISRKEAENLLLKDGDFLVRESQGSAGQYVLTGQQGGHKKHLLLVDPEGVVRTKDRTFESVSHLISFHCEKQLPIISAESALILRHPVIKEINPAN